MTLQSKMLMPLNHLLEQAKSFIKSIRLNSLDKRLIFTVSLGAIGASIAANYYFHFFSLRNKKNNKRKLLNKTQELIQMVILS